MADLAFRGVKYTTLDRADTFDFDFEYFDNQRTWRIYIVSAPSYRARATSQVATHRLQEGGRNYICWDAPIPTLDAAKAVARAWADATQIYIRTGSFPPPGANRHVPDVSPSARWPHSARPGMPASPAPEVDHHPSSSGWLERMRDHWRTS